MHFYPAYKYHEVLKLPANLFQKMFMAMVKVKAKSKLSDMDVSAYPHLEDKVRQRMHRSIFRQAETKEEQAAQVVTSDKLTSMPQITKEMVEKWRKTRSK
jgi:DNA polymerase III delta prime subunit